MTCLQVGRFPYSAYVRPVMHFRLKVILFNIKAAKMLSTHYRYPDYYDINKYFPADVTINIVNIFTSVPIKEQAEKALTIIRATKHLAEMMLVIRNLSEEQS